ncbi:hypothetical protein [Kitasatospora purpeofusca]|uniref:hypothetical protein n=1 Tax=Kitasatospora purpeofusca TaxID=67352 RepID=UPI0036490007
MYRQAREGGFGGPVGQRRQQFLRGADGNGARSVYNNYGVRSYGYAVWNFKMDR